MGWLTVRLTLCHISVLATSWRAKNWASEYIQYTWAEKSTKIKFFTPYGGNWGVSLRSLACWYCCFESRRGHGCGSLEVVACCLVEVCASGWSFVQRSPTECGVSECDRKTSTTRRPWPTMGYCSIQTMKPTGREDSVVILSDWKLQIMEEIWNSILEKENF